MGLKYNDNIYAKTMTKHRYEKSDQERKERVDLRFGFLLLMIERELIDKYRFHSPLYATMT